MLSRLPFLGVGLGFRAQIREQIYEHRTQVDWLEVISEHYLDRPSRRPRQLTELGQIFPLVPHGVELSIGTAGDIDHKYVDALAALVENVNAPWCSDHLCFTRAGGIALGQLIPLARTVETARQVSDKAEQVQAAVGVPFLLENITYYVDVGGQLTEAQFLVEVLEHCEAGLLLDLTNLHINGVNHGFDPYEFLDAIPLERVVQVHLAGGERLGDVLLDSHGAPVPREVFDLLSHVAARCLNLRGVLIERDQHFGDFGELARDLETARTVLAQVRG
jgi:uncharacterized protein